MAMAIESKAKVLSEDDEELDEEPGEVIESAPPMKVGEEREINNSGLKKKLIKRGVGWETPEFGYEVTVQYVATLLDGTKFESTREGDQPLTFKLGHGQVVKGLDMGIVTMKKGETALFTVPSDMGYGNAGRDGVPANSIVQFEVELISWITVVDVTKDGGIIKRILEQGKSDRQPSELDEVLDWCNGPERKANDMFSSIPGSSSLSINLELISFKPVIDVCGDSKVIKKILEEGESLVAADEGAAVTGAPGLKPKLMIVHSQKPLRPHVLATKDNALQTKTPRVDAGISVTLISAIHIQSVAMPPKTSDEVRLTLKPSPTTACRRKLKSIVVCTPDEQGMSLNSGKPIFPPPDAVENIMDILDCDLGRTKCMADALRVPPPLRPSRGASQDVSVFNIDFIRREVNKSGARMTGQVILDKVFHTPFERLHCLKGEFDSLYDLMNERGGGDAIPLRNMFERLIHQARDLNDLQESYSNRMTTEVRESCRVEVDSKLNEASHRLDVESTRYNAHKAKLWQVELRCEELLKELQSLDDQKKGFSCQVVASEDLFQEIEREVIDLQVHIVNAIEVIDPATKASPEKTEAYVKESFEDLETFQWTPYIAKLENGTIFEKRGFDGEASLEFVTDEGGFLSLLSVEQVILGLDRAAMTMKKGEQALLTIRPNYGFGELEVKRDFATVPPSSTLVYEVEMVDFVKEKAPWELSSMERIEAAGKKKEEGNNLFKSGKYLRAGKKYDKAADYVSEEGPFGDEEMKLAKALRVQCWLNGAACNLKLNNFKEAINLCSKVLDVEFNNVKALFRRAQAFIENADLDLAELDIKKALELDPENTEVKMIQKRLKQLQAENNRRDAKMYANMFSRLTKDMDVPTKYLWAPFIFCDCPTISLKLSTVKKLGVAGVEAEEEDEDEDECGDLSWKSQSSLSYFVKGGEQWKLVTYYVMVVTSSLSSRAIYSTVVLNQTSAAASSHLFHASLGEKLPNSLPLK
ncbi:hypothetical protein Cgig2_008211 [Carnegiea gigantea]|uniref:peptidylprolyl isomerase n=1 Tax=Carnegiea gigantea TaxID=171969 RepID=A0A9Q1QSW5_9CARY|nr:hypothetical protein Cgig2_008211 [Carnegiea gigantea]